MKNTNFSISKRIKSFKYALNGLFILFKEEHNSRIHLFAMLLAIILGFVFKIEAYEWLGIILSIGLVIAMEAINSAIENTHPKNPRQNHTLNLPLEINMYFNKTKKRSTDSTNRSELTESNFYGFFLKKSRVNKTDHCFLSLIICYNPRTKIKLATALPKNPTNLDLLANNLFSNSTKIQLY